MSVAVAAHIVLARRGRGCADLRGWGRRDHSRNHAGCDGAHRKARASWPPCPWRQPLDRAVLSRSRISRLCAVQRLEAAVGVADGDQHGAEADEGERPQGAAELGHVGQEDLADDQADGEQ